MAIDLVLDQPAGSLISADRWQAFEDLALSVASAGAHGATLSAHDSAPAVYSTKPPLAAAGETGAVAVQPAAREHGSIQPLKLNPPVSSDGLDGSIMSPLDGESGGSGGYDYSTNAPQYLSGSGGGEIFHWVEDSSNGVGSIRGQFWDADEPYGDELTFSVTTSNSSVASCTIDAFTGDYTIDFGTVGIAELTFTATDKAAQSANSSPPLKVYVVSIAGVSAEERVMGSTTWAAPGDGSLLWAMDGHRWSADIEPDAAEAKMTTLSFWSKPWDSRNDPNVQSTKFAEAISTADGFPKVKGSPGGGNWAIRASATFPGANPMSTSDTQYAVCAVTSTQWIGYGHEAQGARVIDYVDGQSNLDMPNLRFYPEQNHPDQFKDASGVTQKTPDHELHNMVDVQITITPAIPAGMAGTLNVRVYDPDNALADGQANSPDDGDPDSFTNLQEKPNDNYPTGVGMTPVNAEITFAAGATVGEQTYTLPATATRPGNNFIVAIHSNADFSGYRLTEDDPNAVHFKQVTAGSGGSGGGTITWPLLPANLATPTLTVWRTLWTELDSMADPSTQTNAVKLGVFGSGQPQPDDLSFDPQNPATAFLTTQMAGACVRVQAMPAQYDTRDDLEFHHNFPMASSNIVTGTVRDVTSEANFWSAHVVGVYEADDNWDFDGETAWHIGQSNLPIIIYEEVIRDLSANVPGARPEAEIQGHIVLHEVLHRFYGPHSSSTTRQQNLTNTGNMDPATCITGSDAANALSRLQLGEIQKDNPGL